MLQLEYAGEADIAYWQTIDKQLPLSELLLKIDEKRAYILRDNELPIGILRYNLFWDTIPFLNLIFIEQKYQRKGFGTKAVSLWEKEMRSKGYPLVMTSTMAAEESQHFYHKLHYQDCGCLLKNLEPLVETMELFLMKQL